MIEGETVEKRSAGSSGIESNFFLEGNFSKAHKPACHNASRIESNFS